MQPNSDSRQEPEYQFPRPLPADLRPQFATFIKNLLIDFEIEEQRKLLDDSEVQSTLNTVLDKNYRELDLDSLEGPLAREIRNAVESDPRFNCNVRVIYNGSFDDLPDEVIDRITFVKRKLGELAKREQDLEVERRLLDRAKRQIDFAKALNGSDVMLNYEFLRETAIEELALDEQSTVPKELSALTGGASYESKIRALWGVYFKFCEPLREVYEKMIEIAEHELFIDREPEVNHMYSTGQIRLRAIRSVFKSPRNYLDFHNYRLDLEERTLNASLVALGEKDITREPAGSKELKIIAQNKMLERYSREAQLAFEK